MWSCRLSLHPLVSDNHACPFIWALKWLRTEKFLSLKPIINNLYARYTLSKYPSMIFYISLPIFSNTMCWSENPHYGRQIEVLKVYHPYFASYWTNPVFAIFITSKTCNRRFLAFSTSSRSFLMLLEIYRNHSRICYFVKLDFEIAVGQHTKAYGRTFEGIPDSGWPPIPAGQPARLYLVDFWLNFAKSPQTMVIIQKLYAHISILSTRTKNWKNINNFEWN